MLLNTASAPVPVVKIEAGYEVKIISKFKRYSMHTYRANSIGRALYTWEDLREYLAIR